MKSIQTRKGSREAYARAEQHGWRTEVDEKLAAFLADANSFYFATASADGQPYIQHRGGPKGFLKVLDKQTLAFADYAGNQQFLSQGNLSENPKAYIFVMDYAHRRRVKIWGEARVVEDDEALTDVADAQGLPRAARAGDRVQDRRVGHQLPAAHSAEVRRGGCRGGAGGEGSADCGAGSAGRGAEGTGEFAFKRKLVRLARCTLSPCGRGWLVAVSDETGEGFLSACDGPTSQLAERAPHQAR